MTVDIFIDRISTVASPSRHLIDFLCVSSLETTGTLLDSCADCKRERMAALPQGVFAASKVRANMERAKQRQNIAIDEAEANFETKNQQKSGQTFHLSALEIPMKYNSKLMNSIWGLYNRYSVHNFKKNTDGMFTIAGEHQFNSNVPQSTFFATQKN